ncbi:MAG: hypothetical protein KDE46_08645, partial [Caldilineaceae bacterium]|nr:hypothetical protein [Caldilineaceae bacterium]
MSGVRVLVGTQKGAFILTSDEARKDWEISGPHFAGWEIYHINGSAVNPNRLYASQSTGWFGQLIQRSDDGGETWAPVDGDFTYATPTGDHLWYDGTLKPWAFTRVWHLEPSLADPDTVLAGVEDAAMFRSTDGGKSWQLVLHKSDRAGAVDITLDPRNPDILYATVWETHRNFWELSSGGPDSGLWKSTDGGDTWTDISRNPGLPQAGIYGKIGVSASPVQAGRVWALVEASEKPGLYRSDDFGRTWEFLTDDQNLRYRPWYYMHVFADTRNPDTV